MLNFEPYGISNIVITNSNIFDLIFSIEYLENVVVTLYLTIIPYTITHKAKKIVALKKCFLKSMIYFTCVRPLLSLNSSYVN